MLGVVIRGEARAYPLNQLSGPDREVFNEILGGLPVAVTWCDRCHNGIVYCREIAGRTLTFYISGKLWGDSAVLIDVETGSQWSHLLGEAMEGPLKGTKLAELPGVVMTWRQWKSDHPSTTVSILSRTSDHYWQHRYDESSRYSAALRGDGEVVAYSLTQLREETAINERINGKPIVLAHDAAASATVAYSRAMDGKVLEFSADDGQLLAGGSHWDITTGCAVDGPWQGRCLTRLPLVMSYREAWERFYPHGRWGAERMTQ